VNEFRNRIVGGGEDKPLLGTNQRRGAQSLTDVPVKRQESRTTDARSDDRHRIIGQQVIAIHRRKQHTAELINLSGGGAMIAADFTPNLWDRVQIDFGETGRTEAAVRWLKNGRIGLEFAHETQIDCPREQQAALLREVIEQSFPDAINGHAEAAPATSTEPEEPHYARSEMRHPLVWSGTLRLNGHQAEARLRNISSRGAQIESDITLYPDVAVVLDLGNSGSLLATVAWALGDQAGLLFDKEFDLSLLAATPPRVVPRDAKGIPGETADEPWDKGWGRASLNELASSLEGFMKR
jgi:hypothetical protein